MAAPSYTTDLTTLAIGSITVDAGTWDESAHADWDTGGAMVDDGNLYYNGSKCVSAQLTKDSNGSGALGPATIMYNHTSSVTIPTDGAALIHHLWAAPPALNPIATGGIIILIGNSLSVFFGWKISGSDVAPAPRGGWANYAINPAIASPDYTIGAPATPYSMVGIGVAATAQARGNPNACNAVRYGRCESRFTAGDLSNGYATFAGYGAVDSIITNKWNLIDPVEGGFKFQGLMSLGLAATSVDFRDSNKSITIANTIKVTANFNKIEVHNASSNIAWTAISISALGTISKGKFEAVDNATIAFTNCTFTDMDTFIFQSNSTITGTTFRRCGLITKGGASITDSFIESSASSASVITDNLTNLTGNNFTSDGSNHAVELTSIGSGSMTWDNNTSGYATGSTGSPVTPTSTGNEDIYVNVASGTLTINVSSGATTPSIRSAGATVNVVAGQKSFKFTLDPSLTSYEWRLYYVTAVGSLAGAVEKAGQETATADNQTYSYSYTSDQPIAVQIINQPDNDYEESVTYYTLTNSDQDISILLAKDNNN